jgi:hypothetical protein
MERQWMNLWMMRVCLLLAAFHAVAQPIDIETRGQWPGFPGGGAMDVCVVSNYAYVVGPSLQVFDIQNPSQPVRKSGIELPGSGTDLVVTNGLAYVLTQDEKLQVVDISNPTNLVLLGYHFVIDGYGIEVVGNYCYVSGSVPNGWLLEKKLLVFDISNPTNLSQYATLYQDGRVRIVDDLGYFAGSLEFGQSGLAIFEGMSDPLTANKVGQRVTQGTPRNICVTGTNAYLTTSYGLEIFDVSNPAAPAPLGAVLLSLAQDVKVIGSTAFVTDTSIGDGFNAIDVSDPANPLILGAVDLRDYPEGLVVQGTHAYVAGLYDGVRIVDVQNPAEMQYAAIARTSFYGVAIDVTNGFALLANELDGLEIIDVSNPEAPVAVTRVTDGMSSVEGVCIRGSQALVVSSFFDSGFLDSMDIANLQFPVVDDSYMAQGRVYGMDVSGGHAYLATGDGLEIVNISDPTNLVFAGWVDTLGVAVDVRVRGNLAFVADSDTGLLIIDVSNPSAPSWVGTYNTDWRATGVDVSGTHAYVADWEGGLVILDVSNPSAPSLITNVPPIVLATGVTVVDGLAYLNDSWILRIIDVRNPGEPVEVGSHGFGNSYSSFGNVKVVGNLMYAATGQTGMRIFQLVQPLVLHPPAYSNGLVTLTWNGGPGIKLQSATRLDNPDWEDVAGTDGQSAASLSASGEAAFFRLCK